MTSKPDASAANARPFWKEPMVWLVWGLPLASVVAGIWLVVTAVRAGGADPVIDDVQRVSQIQTTDLGPDERAKQLSLGAVFRIARNGVQVFPASGTFDRAQTLHLVLQHPNRGEEDLKVDLKPDELGWSAPLEVDGRHDWKLQLTSATGDWRLRGRLPRGQQAAHLGSSLAEQ